MGVEIQSELSLSSKPYTLGYKRTPRGAPGADSSAHKYHLFLSCTKALEAQ